MKKKLAIIGASGHGRVIADTATLCNRWDQIDFFDDAWPNQSLDMTSGLPWKIIGRTELLLSKLAEYDVIIGIGNNKTREEKYKLLFQHSASIVSVVHPNAYISSYSTLGLGSVIFAHGVINVNSVIGCGCIINTGATVDHDCNLKDFVHVSPGVHLGGTVTIGIRSWLGIGSTIKNNVNIGSDVVVGAGAVVLKDVENSTVVVGVPAKVIKCKLS